MDGMGCCVANTCNLWKFDIANFLYGGSLFNTINERRCHWTQHTSTNWHIFTEETYRKPAKGFNHEETSPNLNPRQGPTLPPKVNQEPKSGEPGPTRAPFPMWKIFLVHTKLAALTAPLARAFPWSFSPQRLEVFYPIRDIRLISSPIVKSAIHL